jgi:glycosyl transferase family 25
MAIGAFGLLQIGAEQFLVHHTPGTLVISMASSADRRALQLFQLQRLGLAFEFVDATTTADVPAPEMAHLQRRWARRLRDTEVACALSHRRAWEIVSRSTEPMLIIEDDAILATDTPAILQAAAALKNVDCVNLETFGAKKTLGRRAPLGVGDYTVARIFRDSAGAAAYLLWPEGARKLLSSFKTMLPLADAAVNLTLNLRKVQVEPACAIQTSILSKTNPISHSIRRSMIARTRPTETRPPFAEWLGYKSRRLQISMILTFQILCGLGRSSRREVKYVDSTEALDVLKGAFPDMIA